MRATSGWPHLPPQCSAYPCSPNSLQPKPTGIALCLPLRHPPAFLRPCPHPLQLGLTPGWTGWPWAQLLWGRSGSGHSLVPVLLGDLVEGPKHSRQHSVAVVLNEAQDILVVPEIQSPLCNLGQEMAEGVPGRGFPACARAGIHPETQGALPSPPILILIYPTGGRSWIWSPTLRGES